MYFFIFSNCALASGDMNFCGKGIWGGMGGGCCCWLLDSSTVFRVRLLEGLGLGAICEGWKGSEGFMRFLERLGF